MSLPWPQHQKQLGYLLGLIAQRAERAGLYSFWMPDHFFQVPTFGNEEDPMLEGWSTLAFVAGRTNRIKLGTMVSGVTYRHPGVLVKQASTLDVLSHGRSYFGLGAGWYEAEHSGLGIPFPSIAERFERLEETLQIALHMWAGDETPYTGTHYQLARPLNAPQPIQRPHPPIVIGGGGERKTLRLVAQYADACNLFAREGTDVLVHKLHVLREHCYAVGRDYATIEKTAIIPFPLTRDGRHDTLSPRAALEYLATLGESGIDHVLFGLPNVTESEPFDLLATEIVPAAAELEVVR